MVAASSHFSSSPPSRRQHKSSRLQNTNPELGKSEHALSELNTSDDNSDDSREREDRHPREHRPAHPLKSPADRHHQRNNMANPSTSDRVTDIDKRRPIRRKSEPISNAHTHHKPRRKTQHEEDTIKQRTTFLRRRSESSTKLPSLTHTAHVRDSSRTPRIPPTIRGSFTTGSRRRPSRESTPLRSENRRIPGRGTTDPKERPTLSR